MLFRYVSDFILKTKKLLLFIIAISSLIALFQAIQVRPSYQARPILPEDDPSYQRYTSFREQFGDDDNVIVIGVQADDIFAPHFLSSWNTLTDSIRNTTYVKETLSITRFFTIEKDAENKRFELTEYTYPHPSTVQSAKDLKDKIMQLPFYKDILWDEQAERTLMSIVLEKNVGKAKERVYVVNKVLQFVKEFERSTKIKTYISGLPYVRSKISDFVLNEFVIFLVLTLLVSIVVLFVLYRNFYSVLFPIISVVIGVVWSLAFIKWLGYNMTLLTGLIPPLMVIIGIPNSILIKNKYRSEWLKCKDRAKTLKNTVRSCCFSTFLANFTTAIGFFVLYFTGSDLLEEFGIVASLSVMLSWIVSLVLIPSMYDFVFHKLNIDKKKNDFYTFPLLSRFLHFANTCSASSKKRNIIFISVIVVTIVAVFGIKRLNVNSFVVDDLSPTNSILKNVTFLEESFEGIVPLEIIVDSKRKQGIQKIRFLQNIENFENELSELDYVSKPLSFVQAIRFVNQAFYNGEPNMYRVPTRFEKDFILLYLKNSNTESVLLRNYVDSTGRYARLSFRMKDIGSEQSEKLYEKVDSLGKKHFKNKPFHITGTGEVYFAGTKYLVNNLIDSLLLAIVFISVVMWLFFKNYKMVIIATLPNLIPIAITAGIMGYFGVPIKPSTISIFGVALGIASDQTIYLLSKLMSEKNEKTDKLKLIISEVGVSMAYITTLLILGLGVFLFSDFKGTVYLGLLLSLTLFTTFFSNLFFLPAMLRKFKITL